jgi:hypothetical protein
LLKTQLAGRDEELARLFASLDDLLGLKGFTYARTLGSASGSKEEREKEKGKQVCLLFFYLAIDRIESDI